MHTYIIVREPGTSTNTILWRLLLHGVLLTTATQAVIHNDILFLISEWNQVAT